MGAAARADLTEARGDFEISSLVTQTCDVFSSENQQASGSELSLSSHDMLPDCELWEDDDVVLVMLDGEHNKRPPPDR
jgi:hypothetical protein